MKAVSADAVAARQQRRLTATRREVLSAVFLSLHGVIAAAEVLTAVFLQSEICGAKACSGRFCRLLAAAVRSTTLALDDHIVPCTDTAQVLLVMANAGRNDGAGVPHGGSVDGARVEHLS